MLTLCLLACGDAAESESPPATDTGCAPDEVTSEGGCSRPGVSADACAAGFEPDVDGCRPVLPAAPCGFGTIATPGMTACAPVAPCGEGTWGSIRTDGLTEFVDGAYLGGASDGSAARP